MVLRVGCERLILSKIPVKHVQDLGQVHQIQAANQILPDRYIRWVRAQNLHKCNIVIM